MEILKKHYEKFILGMVLLLSIMLLFILRADKKEVDSAEEEKTVKIDASENSEDVVEFLLNEKKLGKDNFSVKEDLLWDEKNAKKIYSINNMILCIDPNCKTVIPFDARVCFTCDKPQGLSKNERVQVQLELKKYEDDDKDGIMNGIEDKFTFMDKSNPLDFYLDEDDDGFTNGEEILGADWEASSLDSQKEMFNKEIFFITNPEDPKSRQPLISKLRILNKNNEENLGITLTNVIGDADDKSTWEMHFNVRDDKNKIKTAFEFIGGELKAKNGMKFKIADVSYITKDIRNRTTKTVTPTKIFTVILKDEKGIDYSIKVNEYVKHGEKTVEFILMTNAFLKNCQRVKVEGLAEFELVNKSKGEVLSTERFAISEIDNIVKVKQISDGKIHTVLSISAKDREFIKKRTEAERKKVINE